MLEKTPQGAAPAQTSPRQVTAKSTLSRPAAQVAGAGRRGWRWLAIPALALSLAACGGGHYDAYDPYYGDPYYGDPYYGDGSYCNPANYPAIAVRFVDARNLGAITIGALGTVSDGRTSEEMTSPEPGYAVDGRTSVLEGAFGQTGLFNVSVATRAGERYDWTAIRVTGTRCQIDTVYLDAPVHYPDP